MHVASYPSSHIQHAFEGKLLKLSNKTSMLYTMRRNIKKVVTSTEYWVRFLLEIIRQQMIGIDCNI